MNGSGQWKEFESFVEEVMAEFKVPGLAVAFAQEGKLVYARGFGVRDRATGEPVTPHTVFGIGSVTKSFTGLAIMQLQEEGKLSVHDPVVRHLPEFRLPAGQPHDSITIHHFLTHTSGLPPQAALGYAVRKSMEGYPKYDEEADKKVAGQTEAPPRETPPMETYDDLLKYLGTTDYRLLGAPGECFSYSNDAYALLGAVIEKASGLSYAEFLREHITGPAGMTRTTLSLAEMAAWSDVTRLYFKNKAGDILDVPQWQDTPALPAAGFLRSSACDMLRYGEIYVNLGTAFGHRFLSPISVADMIAPGYLVDRAMHYGYGLFVEPYHGVTLVEHGGALTGVAAQFGCVPEEKIVGMVLTNLAGAPSNEIWLAGINQLLGLPLETKRSVEPEYAPSPGHLERFVGTYRSGEGTKVDIVLEDGALFAVMQGERFSMRPSGEDRLAVNLFGRERPARFLADAAKDIYAVFFGLRIVHKVKDETAAS
ncbi:MAG: serine hydrolase domain-containing protein [Bacillota bacterium]